jgi:hypothetical protein
LFEQLDEHSAMNCANDKAGCAAHPVHTQHENSGMAVPRDDVHSRKDKRHADSPRESICQEPAASMHDEAAQNGPLSHSENWSGHQPQRHSEGQLNYWTRLRRRGSRGVWGTERHDGAGHHAQKPRETSAHSGRLSPGPPSQMSQPLKQHMFLRCTDQDAFEQSTQNHRNG